MHLTNSALSGRRVPALDGMSTRGMFIEFYDPDGTRHGIPTYPYRWAPGGLATIRQLRAKGLRPGGQDIAAQILWRHRKQRRVAYLYREDLAKPKRHATPAQLAAIGRALRARRTCPSCGTEKPYYIPRSTGECNDCTAGWDPMTALPARLPSTVNRSLTPNRPRRVVENDEYAAFLRRVIRAYSRRVGAGDIEAIADMAATADEMDTAIQDAITGLRAIGYSWADIACASASPARPSSNAGAVNPGEHPRPGRIDDLLQIIILLLIGAIAGAASFTHVHDWTMRNVPAGTSGWFGWANAIISELTPTAAGLEIRRRKRTHQPVAYPMTVLIAAAVLSLAAQVAQARHSLTGWLVAAVPALAFLALTKLVLSAHHAATSRASGHTRRRAPAPPSPELITGPAADRYHRSC